MFRDWNRRFLCVVVIGRSQERALTPPKRSAMIRMWYQKGCRFLSRMCRYKMNLHCTSILVQRKMDYSGRE